MAIIRTSSLISDVTGSIAGTTFQRSPYGIVAHTKRFTPDYRTSAQSDIRSKLYQLQVAWRQLTDAQRQAWQSYVDYQQLKTSGVNSVTMYAQSAFIQTNFYRLLLHLSIISNPTFTPYSLPQPTLSFITLDPSDLRVSFSFSASISDYYPILFLSFVQRSTRSTPSSQLRFIFPTAISNNTWQLGSSYISAFGRVPSDDENIFCEYALLQTSNSVISSFSRSLYTVHES